MTLRALTAAAGAAALLLASGCATNTETTETQSGVKLVKDGTLTVCTHLPYKPFQYTKDGEIVGFDIEVVQAVAAKAGIEVKFVDDPNPV